MKLLSALLAAAALAAGAARPLPAAQSAEAAPDDVPALVATLEQQKDAAEVDLVKKLANKKTREALDGLLKVYDSMQSVYMRRAICQGLALYDDVRGAEQPALEHLMNVAVGAKERELRRAAIDLLGGCDSYGRPFLRRIVESTADDEVRERALSYHVQRATPEDAEWYRGLYRPEAEQKDKRKGDDAEKVPHPLPALRLLAFQALSRDLPIEEVVRASADRSEKIRASALAELARRDAKEALDVAEDLWDKATETPSTRLAAARIVLRARGAKVADDFVKEATKAAAPRELAFGLGDLLIELDDPAVDKKLLKGLGKGKGTEALFYLRVTRDLEDDKVAKSAIKLLSDKDPELRRAACEVLGERRERAALPALEERIAEGEEPLVVGAALAAVTRIRTNDADWERRLGELAADPRPVIRNAAIGALGATRNPDHLEPIVAALDHELWSTRLAAARALETLRVAEAVGPLIARLGQEEGRMKIELAEVLFRLTGQTFGQSERQWAAWWQDASAGFQLIEPSKLAAIEQVEESRRLKQITRTEFFGIRIESHRAIFILDVSGSMREPTRGKYVGDKGEPRIDLAKRELLKALDGLEPGSFFNIVTFSSDVNPWRDRIAQKDEATLAEAKGFVERLGADGGTNLWGALEAALNDRDVDTIYVLSDGEPTVGALTDALAIRERVAALNQHRGVVLHAIAVGGELSILEGLAQDSGGSYVEFP